MRMAASALRVWTMIVAARWRWGISILATASRGLMEGNAQGGDVVISLVTATALTLIFAPLTTRLYRRG